MNPEVKRLKGIPLTVADEEYLEAKRAFPKWSFTMDKQAVVVAKVGKTKMDRLQQIWNNSYPSSQWSWSKAKTKAEDFTDKAKKQGFKDKDIKLFLSLC